MSIICLEGASAVGKTTTARALETAAGAFAVAEVNQLFKRPENETVEWYFERQVERWSIAGRQKNFYSMAVLDGDPFQPLWYNWAYDFANWQDLDFMERFYQPRIRNKTIGFPDLYFILSASEIELRNRKTGDATRQRRGFEWHLQLIEPQRRYFQAMHAFSPNRVFFLETETIEANVDFIRARAEGLSERNPDESIDLFDKMIRWLRENKA